MVKFLYYLDMQGKMGIETKNIIKVKIPYHQDIKVII
jgi:hypothetical protein